MLSSPQSVVSIRPLRGQIDFDAAVALQRDVWGYSELDVECRGMLTVASRFVGQTIGAFDDDRLVGFALAFAALPVGHLHSHRVGVHPEYQNLGIGRKLKLAQREDALARGLHVMQWTFDPLQPRNAYFNLVRLGGVAKTYIPNLYGITTSPLHGGLPTDRLLIEWRLESDRVRRILAGETPRLSSDVQEIHLPPAARRGNQEEQAILREEFLARLDDGYLVTGFRGDGESQSYILEKLCRYRASTLEKLP